MDNLLEATKRLHQELERHATCRHESEDARVALAALIKAQQHFDKLVADIRREGSVDGSQWLKSGTRPTTPERTR